MVGIPAELAYLGKWARGALLYELEAPVEQRLIDSTTTAEVVMTGGAWERCSTRWCSNPHPVVAW